MIDSGPHLNFFERLNKSAEEYLAAQERPMSLDAWFTKQRKTLPLGREGLNHLYYCIKSLLHHFPSFSHQSIGAKPIQFSDFLELFSKSEKNGLWTWIVLRQKESDPLFNIPGHSFSMATEDKVLATGLRVETASLTDPELLSWYGVPAQFHDIFSKRLSFNEVMEENAFRILESLTLDPMTWFSPLTGDGAKALKSNYKFRDGYFFSETQIDYRRTAFLRDGLVQIQDFSSQTVCKQVKANPGDFVWDCCAGSGGKSLQIASKLSGKGAVFSSDIREPKLLQLKRRARQAQISNLRTFVADAQTPIKFPNEVKLHGGFDWILVDAPCSGSGTWRRNPEMKYQNQVKEIEGFSRTQLDILKNVKNSLRKGGTLIYSTCSLSLDENENVTKEFLKASENWVLKAESLTFDSQMESDFAYFAVFRKIEEPKG